MEKTYEMLQQYAVNSLEYQKGRALHQRGQAALQALRRHMEEHRYRQRLEI